MTAPAIDLSFSQAWKAEILSARPLILPTRQYVYPREAEEVERGALEVLIQPEFRLTAIQSQVSESSPPPHGQRAVRGHPRPGAPTSSGSQPFLATCALGFRDPVVPTGLWSAPNPNEICAVSGGYAYMIDTTAPDRFMMIPYRPVLEVLPVVAEGLLLFVGHHSILAWGPNGQAWESGKLSDEGLTITAIENGLLHGTGWELVSDKETPFALDLRTGLRTS